MATETTYIKLIKDAQHENYNVDKVNANLDKVDLALGTIARIKKNVNILATGWVDNTPVKLPYIQIIKLKIIF